MVLLGAYLDTVVVFLIAPLPSLFHLHCTAEGVARRVKGQNIRAHSAQRNLNVQKCVRIHKQRIWNSIANVFDKCMYVYR